MNEKAPFTLKKRIRFVPESRKKEGKLIRKNVPIRGYVTFNGIRIFFPTGARCDLSKWDNIKERVKPNTLNTYKQKASDLNYILDSLYAGLEDFFRSCEYNRTTPNKKDILTAVRNLRNRRKPLDNTVDSLFDEFIQKEGLQGAWSKGTKQKVETIQRHIKKFNPDLKVGDITPETLSEFMQYLINKGLRDSTVNKAVKVTKWFCRWAADSGYMDNPEVLKFRPKYKKPKNPVIVFLTWDELMTLYDLDVSGPKLSEAKDCFLFSCFTGLRYSDVKRLKKSDIKENEIVTTTKKTDATLSIELNKYSRAILDKYKDIPGPLALPVADNGELNDRLKTIGELAKFNDPITKVYYRAGKRIEDTRPKSEYLTFHVGRRTFVTNSLYLGIPAQVIMKWTGHSDFETMKPYLAIVDKMKQAEMNKWDK